MFQFHLDQRDYSTKLIASKVEGTPFAEYITTGNLGRFLGFLACLIQASYTIAGPEYVAMTAGEVASKFKTVFLQVFS